MASGNGMEVWRRRNVPRLLDFQTMPVSFNVCYEPLSYDCTHKLIFACQSDSILVINVLEQSVYLVGDATILKSGTHRVPRDGRYKYLGGALTSDGQYAYLFPW